jgi:hypothetical protein
MDLGVLLEALKLGDQPERASTRHSGPRPRGGWREAERASEGGSLEDSMRWRGGWPPEVRKEASAVLVALHVAGHIRERETERLECSRERQIERGRG